MAQAPAITIADLPKLQEQANRPQALTVDEVQDFAVASLMVLRGMSRRDKIRVLTRMRRILG